MKIRDSFSLNNLDRNLAIFGIFLSLALIIFLSFFIGRFVYVFVGILTLISCILWLLIRRQAFGEICIRSNSTFLLLNIVFFLLLTCNVLFVYFRTNIYERPLIFFIFLSFMFGIVALEILFYKTTVKHQFLILSQIIILSFISVWSQLLIFPNLIGIDPWAHQVFTLKILNTGFIPQGYSYSFLPLMHLETASTSLITGLDYKWAAAFSVTLSHIICTVLFIFLLGKFITHIKVALLASLLLITGNYYIYIGMIAIPNTMAAIFIPIILYLLLTNQKKNFLIGNLLTMFFAITLIFTHTVSSVCMLIILFIINLISYSINKIYPEKKVKFVTMNIAVFFLVVMFSCWIYLSGHIITLAKIIQVGFQEEIFVNAPKAIIGYAASVPVSEQIFNQLGAFLFFSISFIGCFYMISKKYGNFYTLIIAVVGIVPLAIGLFGTIFGYFVIEERWWYFSQILLTIPLSIAFIIFCSKIKNKSLKPIFLFCLTVILSFLLIMSSKANLDNHMFSPNTGVRLALTESEIKGAAFFSEKSIKPLLLDHDYSLIITNYYSLKDKRVKSLDTSLLTEDFSSGGTILIREEIINRPFRLFRQPFKLNYDLTQALETQGFSRIYDSNSVFGFYLKN